MEYDLKHVLLLKQGYLHGLTIVLKYIYNKNDVKVVKHYNFRGGILDNINANEFSNKMLRNIYDGAVVTYIKKEGFTKKIEIPAKIENITINNEKNNQGYKGDYNFNLINLNTGDFFKDLSGKIQKFSLKKLLESGKIILHSEALIQCPHCKRFVLKEGQSICYECAHKKKKEFFKNKQ